ncbi:MAG: NAD(P)-binding domain-containing protein, partial [Turicibacter sp.]|nr:NAD(P)-binding domain-containing protein [Turicibacter sp.]
MKKIAFIGGGNMGKSIIGGMIKNNYSNELIYVATPFETEVYALKETFKVNVDTSNINIVNECDVVVFAVKPQVSNDVFTELKKANIDFSNKLIITIMAGVKTEKIAANLKNAEKIIRVMPNT